MGWEEVELGLELELDVLIDTSVYTWMYIQPF